MRAIGRWLKDAALFALRNADAIFAMAVAVAVIISLAIGDPSSEVVDTAILGLLAAVALAFCCATGRESAGWTISGDSPETR